MRLHFQDAANHRFDIDLCKSIGRFGRNVTEAQQVINELHRSGVHVIFCSGAPGLSMHLSGKSELGIIASLYEQNTIAAERERWPKRAIEATLDNGRFTGDARLAANTAFPHNPPVD